MKLTQVARLPTFSCFIQIIIEKKHLTRKRKQDECFSKFKTKAGRRNACNPHSLTHTHTHTHTVCVPSLETANGGFRRANVLSFPPPWSVFTTHSPLLSDSIYGQCLNCALPTLSMLTQHHPVFKCSTS